MMARRLFPFSEANSGSRGPRLISVLLALGLLAAACAGEEEGGDRAAPAPGECRLEDDSVKIAAQGARSGAHADYGKQIEMGATLAAEEINDEGGILGCSVELTFADSELNPDVGITNARRFVNEFGAHFLTGIDSSGVALAVAPIMPDLNRILIVTHAATEKLTEDLVFEQGNDFVFRASVPVYQDAIAAALLFEDMPEVKRFATIGADYEYGRTAWDMFKATLRELRPDVEFVGEAWAPFLTTDFSPHISKVIGANPDVIFATPWAGEAVTLLRQSLGMGVFDEIDIWWQAMGGSIDVLQALTQDVQAGNFQDKLFATGRYLFNYPDTERNNEFVEVFRERWDRFPNYSAATTYAAVYLIKEAVEETRTLEPQPNIRALEGMRLDTPLGDDYSIRAEDHQAVYNVPVGRVVFNEEFGIACVCEDVTVFDSEEYYRNPPFE